MMWISLSLRAGCRAAAGVAAIAAAAILLRHYGAAEAGPRTPPVGALCDAPVPGVAQPGTAVRGQIRYDGGQVLRYCSLAQMFAQLGAQEQPGIVRAAYVLGEAGDWLEAPQAGYLRRHGPGAGLLAYAAGMAAPTGAALLNYQQLLRACARGDCLRGTTD